MKFCFHTSQRNVGNISSACSPFILQDSILYLSQKEERWTSEGPESCNSFSRTLGCAVKWPYLKFVRFDHITLLLSPSEALSWLLFQKWGNWYKKTLKWGRQCFSKMDLIETKWYYETLFIPDTYVLNKYHLLSWIYWPNLYCDSTACQLLLFWRWALKVQVLGTWSEMWWY